MKQTVQTVFAVLLSLTLLAGVGSVLQAEEVTGAGEEISFDDAGAFISLMTEASDEVEESSLTADRNPEEVDGAPEAELEEAARFVAEQYELVESSPQSVTIIDRAHTSINDDLVLCLEMKRDSEKSKLTFNSLEFCQGLGTNLLHKLTIKNADGEKLLTYTLDSYVQ